MFRERFMHNREILAVFIAVGVFVAMTTKYLLEDIAPTHSIPLILKDNLRITPVPYWEYHTRTALVWSFIMLLHAFDNRDRIFTATSGLAGFCASFAVTSFTTACIMAIFGLIYVSLMKIFDDHKMIKEGVEPDRMKLREAFCASTIFGMGVLIPFGYEYGFYVAMILPLMGYLLVNTILCLAVFGILHAMLLLRRSGGENHA